ncbi:hypothetical protein [Sphingobium yanoikuyae]
MAVFLVTYDLKQGSGTHDYADLYKAFERLESVKILYSVYLVATTSTATEVDQYLRSFMDPKDRLWVSEVHKGEYSGRVMTAGVEWLRNNPPRP